VRRRKWRRPATDFPDRKHAANVADLVHDARITAEERDRKFYDELLKGESNGESNVPTS
jgi:hypothetical protein